MSLWISVIRDTWHCYVKRVLRPCARGYDDMRCVCLMSACHENLSSVWLRCSRKLGGAPKKLHEARQAWSGWVWPGSVRQGWVRQGRRGWPGLIRQAGLGWARCGMARFDGARHGSSGMAGLGAMRPGEAWQAGGGLVWSGMGGKAWQASCGGVWRSLARLGQAGAATQGEAWSGVARPGLAGAVGSVRFG